MRDKTHNHFIERWVLFMKKHPDEWRDIHTDFINAQFQGADDVIRRLVKQKGGREKLIALYGIKNIKGYEELLG
jgi:hypothetical protein